MWRVIGSTVTPCPQPFRWHADVHGAMVVLPPRPLLAKRQLERGGLIRAADFRQFSVADPATARFRIHATRRASLRVGRRAIWRVSSRATACQARTRFAVRCALRDTSPTPCGWAETPSRSQLWRASSPPGWQRRTSRPALAWLSSPDDWRPGRVCTLPQALPHQSRVAHGLIEPRRTVLPSRSHG